MELRIKVRYFYQSPEISAPLYKYYMVIAPGKCIEHITVKIIFFSLPATLLWLKEFMSEIRKEKGMVNAYLTNDKSDKKRNLN